MKISHQLNCLCLVLFFLTSCSKSHDNRYVPYHDAGIHVGVLVSLSGSGFSSGEACKASLELAKDDLLAYFELAGIGKQVTLVFADTKTDTAEALKQMKTFYDKGIRVVIGPYSSAELSAVRQFANTHDMLVVSPSSVAVSLAIAGDNIFRFVSSDLLQAKAMAKMLTEDKINIVVPLIRNDVWGNDLLATTEREFRKNGGTMQPPVKYHPETADFTGVLSQLDTAVSAVLETHDPNDVAVYLLCFAEGAPALSAARNYASMNNVYWYGSSAFSGNSAVFADTNSALFAYTHGLPCPVFGLDDAAKPKWQPLRERIQALIGRMPDNYAITAYDALWVLAKTLISAGSNPSIEKLKNAFVAESDNYFGASGHTLLNADGDRAIGNYDFWAVKKDSSGFCWKMTARYNSADGSLTRFKP